MDASWERLPQLAASSFTWLSASPAVCGEVTSTTAVPTVAGTPSLFDLDKARRAAEQAVGADEALHDGASPLNRVFGGQVWREDGLAPVVWASVRSRFCIPAV